MIMNNENLKSVGENDVIVRAYIAMKLNPGDTLETLNPDDYAINDNLENGHFFITQHWCNEDYSLSESRKDVMKALLDMDASDLEDYVIFEAEVWVWQEYDKDVPLELQKPVTKDEFCEVMFQCGYELEYFNFQNPEYFIN